MTRPLGRRRYAGLLKFLNETISDATLPHSSRLSAAQTLGSLLQHRDDADERVQLARERAAARKASADARMAELALAERGIRLNTPPAVNDDPSIAASDRIDNEERKLFDRLLSAPEASGHAQ